MRWAATPCTTSSWNTSNATVEEQMTVDAWFEEDEVEEDKESRTLHVGVGEGMAGVLESDEERSGGGERPRLHALLTGQTRPSRCNTIKRRTVTHTDS